MINKTLIKPVALVGSGVVTGAVVTYLVVNTRLKKKYIAIAEEEIESVKRAHRKFDPNFDFTTASPAAVAAENADRKEFLNILDEQSYAAREDAEAHYNHTDVIAAEDPRWPVEDTEELGLHITPAELKEHFETLKPGDQGYWAAPNVVVEPENLDKPERIEGLPYGISVDDFMQGLDTHDTQTVTYYEEDNTLTDERESIIPDIEKSITEYALTRFGKESGDKRIVYVRNEKIQTDFEVIKDEGSYAELVLGIALAREKNPIKKMRAND